MVEVDPTPYLKGKAMAPNPNEMGWKDTVQMSTGEVTTIRVRFAPIDGSANYPFDATTGPGYVWHCHILDHEDNEMILPYEVLPAPLTLLHTHSQHPSEETLDIGYFKP